MKKLKKINLNLNKEVVSNLSNDNLNQVKGGSGIQCPPIQSHPNCGQTYVIAQCLTQYINECNGGGIITVDAGNCNTISLKTSPCC